MADFNDDGTQTDEDLDELEDDDATSDPAEESDEDGDESDEPLKKPSDKSVAALQSARDKETARANKAEKELAKLRNKDDGEAQANPELEAVREDLREAALDAVFAEFSELRDYGISRDLVDGYSRAEVRENSQALVALVKKVATKARNQALSDAGLKADPGGSVRTKPVDYARMTSEDFNKLVDGVG